MVAVLEDIGGGLVDRGGPGAMLRIRALTRALEDVVSARPGSASNNDREAWLHGHTRQAGAEKLVALIRSVAGGG